MGIKHEFMKISGRDGNTLAISSSETFREMSSIFDSIIVTPRGQIKLARTWENTKENRLINFLKVFRKR